VKDAPSDAIVVDSVTKRFRIPLDHSTTLKYRMTHLRSSGRYRDFLALDGVTFSCPQGQFLGITGPNGCGKSTLLKILSRIYTADKGKVQVVGRVSPFLELGVGFNPELTARENIFLGGAVLGLTKSQLVERVDSILDFAELHQFADQKLKNFSSGMGVRLAFSVAIQADADILLMDEVLAVGDARFQEKCFDIFSAYKKRKKTIVLVSHDLSSLEAYCDRVLLLRNGRLEADGPAHEVISRYRRDVATMSEGELSGEDAAAVTQPSARWGGREIEITDVRLLDKTGSQVHTFLTGESMTVAVDYVVNAKVDEFVCGLAFKRRDGLNLAGPNSKAAQIRIPGPEIGTTGTVSYEITSVGLLRQCTTSTASIPTTTVKT
jgi:ABC-type polysaccharide/polyol phosphate transport system ATPase subunit